MANENDQNQELDQEEENQADNNTNPIVNFFRRLNPFKGKQPQEVELREFTINPGDDLSSEGNKLEEEDTELDYETYHSRELSPEEKEELSHLRPLQQFRKQPVNPPASNTQQIQKKLHPQDGSNPVSASQPENADERLTSPTQNKVNPNQIQTHHVDSLTGEGKFKMQSAQQASSEVNKLKFESTLLNSTKRTLNILDGVRTLLDTGNYDRCFYIKGDAKSVHETLKALYTLAPDYQGAVYVKIGDQEAHLFNDSKDTKFNKQVAQLAQSDPKMQQTYQEYQQLLDVPIEDTSPTMRK